MSKLFTVSEAAAHRGVTRARIIQLIKEKRLKAVKVGSQYVIKPADLERLAVGPIGRPPKK